MTSQSARANHRQQRFLSNLHNTVAAMLQSSTKHEVAEIGVEAIRTATEFGYAGVRLLDDRGDYFLHAVASADAPELANADRQPYDAREGMLADFFRAGKPLVISDLQAMELPMDYGPIRSIVAVPIQKHGFLSVGAFNRDAFEPEDIEFIETVGHMLEPVMDRLAHDDVVRSYQERLEKRSRHLREVIDLLPHFVYAHDLDGNMLLANTAIEPMFGAPVEEIEAGRLHDFLESEEMADKVVADAREILKAGGIQRYERQMSFGGGSYIFDITKRPYKSLDASQPAFLSIAIDVTSLRRSEAMLEDSRRELEKVVGQLQRSNEALEEFAYAASHDLQEPLRMVSSFLSLLERKYADRLDAKGLEYIDHAVRGASRMQEMIQGLLRLSRLEREPRVDDEIDLTEMLGHVEQVLAGPLTESGATLRAEVESKIVGPKVQLEQIVTNLILNAIEHGQRSDLIIDVDCQESATFWELSVSDNGVGIPEARQERIFDVFMKGSRDSNGSGIGLAISKRLIESIGGEIWVESMPEHGSTFFVTIPKPSPKQLS